jgi:hypothetical protein
MSTLKRTSKKETKQQINRHIRLEICAVDSVEFHKELNDHKFNTVTVVMRDRAKRSDSSKSYYRAKLPTLQSFMGGNHGGSNWNPRKGDLVWVFFYKEREGIVLGNAWSWAEYPVCRPTPYDIVDKGGQWMEPYQDGNGDFPLQPYPSIKKPYCFRWFHGPVKGTIGPGRDWCWLFDYCQMGDCTPSCKDCKTIDSIQRLKNQYFKFYSEETESRKAYPYRAEFHAYCGSFWLFESKDRPSSDYVSEVYTEGKGYWTVQGSKIENGVEVFKGHLRHSPNGTMDIHSTTEAVPLSGESTGSRCAVIAPEDSTVDFAWQIKDFVQNVYAQALKNGKIEINSPTEVLVKAPLITLDGDVVVTGNLQVPTINVGSCSHGSCSCSTSAAMHVDLASGRVMRQEGTNQVPVGSLAAAKIACCNSSKMACLASANYLYELVDGEWVLSLAGVADMCYSPDGLLHIIDTPAINLYRREENGSWTALSGQCLRVAAASATIAYVIGADERLWKNDAGTWTSPESSTAIIDISVANDGTVYAIRKSDKALLKLAGSSYVLISGALALKEISARDAYHIFGIGDADDIVYLWNDVRWTSQGVTAASVGLSSV